MNHRARRLAFAAGILLLSMSACGSNGSAKSSTTTGAPRTADSPRVDTAFQARAAAVCKAAGDKLRAQGAFPFPDFNPEHPDASKLARIADYEAKTVATERSWDAQLLALGQPSSGESAWNIFVERIGDAVKETAAQQVAAQRGNGAAFTRTFQELSSAGLANHQIAVQVGLPSCDPGALGNPDAKQPVPVRRP